MGLWDSELAVPIYTPTNGLQRLPLPHILASALSFDSSILEAVTSCLNVP